MHSKMEDKIIVCGSVEETFTPNRLQLNGDEEDNLIKMLIDIFSDEYKYLDSEFFLLSPTKNGEENGCPVDLKSWLRLPFQSKELRRTKAAFINKIDELSGTKIGSNLGTFKKNRYQTVSLSKLNGNRFAGIPDQDEDSLCLLSDKIYKPDQQLNETFEVKQCNMNATFDFERDSKERSSLLRRKDTFTKTSRVVLEEADKEEQELQEEVRCRKEHIYNLKDVQEIANRQEATLKRRNISISSPHVLLDANTPVINGNEINSNTITRGRIRPVGNIMRQEGSSTLCLVEPIPISRLEKLSLDSLNSDSPDPVFLPPNSLSGLPCSSTPLLPTKSTAAKPTIFTQHRIPHPRMMVMPKVSSNLEKASGKSLPNLSRPINSTLTNGVLHAPPSKHPLIAKPVPKDRPNSNIQRRGIPVKITYNNNNNFHNN